MQDDKSPAEAVGSREEALRGLLDLLEVERLALVRMDAADMESISARKDRLTAALGSFGAPATRAEKVLAGAVRDAAVKNHVLLAHARDCVRAAIGSLDPGAGPKATPPPLRVDVRG
jgi:hypothetical protein